MYILVACEESQIITKEFRNIGHNAYSCDIQPCSGGEPEWHIHGDALRLLHGRVTFQTQDGKMHVVPKWDIMIAHPPCTYLSNACAWGYKLTAKTTPQKVIDRWKERARAAVFFMQFVSADCDKIAIENPVGFMNTAYRKPDQIINPWQFASSIDDKENYTKKKTCLWLKGLPPLKTNDLPEPNLKELYGVYKNNKAKTWCEQRHDGKARSKTFPGIARAIANQWG